MRNLVEVIDQMLLTIPESEQEFIAALKSAVFSSPETMCLRWEVTADCLEDYLPLDESSMN